MRTSRTRWPEAAAGAGAATVEATGAGAATTGAGSTTGADAMGAGAAGAKAAGTPPPAASSLMRRTKSTVEGGSLVSLVWWRANKILEISADSSSTSTMAELGSSSWRRSLSSKDSIWWVSSATSLKPNVAAPPFTEWAHRKMPFKSSSLAVTRSILSSICSMRSKFSPASSKKIW